MDLGGMMIHYITCSCILSNLIPLRTEPKISDAK